MKVLIRDGKQVEEADDVLKQTALFKAIATDAARYSITPTTFETREYEKDLDSWYHVDQFQHKGSKATRFGLNDKSAALQAAIKSECKTFDASARPPSTVKSTKYLPKEAKSIALCSLEQSLIDIAIEHMIKSDERAVVVDILARVNGGGDNGFVKLVDPTTPEIHSVVLYMNPTPQATAQGQASSVATAAATQVVSVIDPSNLLFSVHLSNYNPQVSGTVYEISTFHKSIRIYKPGGPIGPNPDQFRDCIDVAAKLAMNFNAATVHYDLANLKKTLLACEVVRKVANQIDTKISDSKLPIRAKQTSDIDLSGQLYKVLCMLNQNLGALEFMVDQAVVDKLFLDSKRILSQVDKAPLEITKELCYHNGECVGYVKGFSDHAEAEQHKLLGEVDPTV